MRILVLDSDSDPDTENHRTTITEELLAHDETLARKLAEIENKYDGQFKVVFDVLTQLMSPPDPPRKQIGFQVKERHAAYRIQ